MWPHPQIEKYNIFLPLTPYPSSSALSSDFTADSLRGMLVTNLASVLTSFCSHHANLTIPRENTRNHREGGLDLLSPGHSLYSCNLSLG